MCCNVGSIDYSSSAVEHIYTSRHVCFGAYTNNVKCSYKGTAGDTLNCTELK